jgi:hypothetical protein
LGFYFQKLLQKFPKVANILRHPVTVTNMPEGCSITSETFPKELSHKHANNSEEFKM